jgi:hypothetical protein
MCICNIVGMVFILKGKFQCLMGNSLVRHTNG